MIEINSLTLSYGAKPVVEDLTLTLAEGGITALIGPNGAGKSTLLAAVGRLHPIEKGTVAIDGRELGQWPTGQLAKVLAILRQENHLAVRLTVEELVMLGRHPHNGGRPRPEDHDKVAQALQTVQMTDLANRFLDELSGGQRQRSFVAMALAQETKYLLLDEPLSALDMHYSREMMRHLQRVCKARDLAVVVVIHDINTAATYADQMVALKEGKVCAQGTPTQVMTASTLEDIYDVQVEVTTMSGRPVAMPIP